MKYNKPILIDVETYALLHDFKNKMIQENSKKNIYKNLSWAEVITTAINKSKEKQEELIL